MQRQLQQSATSPASLHWLPITGNGHHRHAPRGSRHVCELTEPNSFRSSPAARRGSRRLALRGGSAAVPMRRGRCRSRRCGSPAGRSSTRRTRRGLPAGARTRSHARVLSQARRTRAEGRGYTGWDADGRQLTGHIAGHYLSAVSLMCAATGDARFKQRADYIVSELKAVQDKHGDGFAGALQGVQRGVRRGLEGQHPVGELRSQRPVVAVVHAAQDLRRPARRVSPHRQPDARSTSRSSSRNGPSAYLAPMNDEQIQRMLATEFGGMNEMMADLYADTGDKRWLDLSISIRAQGGARSAQARRRSAGRPARQHAGAEADRLGRALRLRRRPQPTSRRPRSSGSASSTTTPSRPAATARTNTSASPTSSATSPTAAPPKPATSTTC